MSGNVVEIYLFGACAVRATAKSGFEITAVKQKALFALLATAPLGRRTRSFLQDILWGTTCYDTGRQSLRRALSDIKHIMGDDFGRVFSVNNTEVTLDLSQVRFGGNPGEGEFLEGLDVWGSAFSSFREAIRRNPGQLAGLYSASRGADTTHLQPTVSILPFRALGGNVEDATLGDWLAEETCRSLSRSRLLTVISHLSCRQIAVGTVDIAEIRRSLGVDFCVAGTIRRAGSEIVLDADFIDTRTGRLIWTRRFANSVSDFFQESQQGIADIVSSVGCAIADEALRHVRGQPPALIEDHRLLIAGVSLMHRSTLREFARARELIEEAARRAPYQPEVHAWLGKWYILSVFNGWSGDASLETAKALDCTARALDLSPDNAFCLTIDGFANNNLLRRMDVADRRYASALEATPNSALTWLLKGVLHAFRDEGAKAVAATSKARRLSPLDPFGYFYDSLNATAYLAEGNYQKSLELADRSLTLNDRHLSTLRTKIVALHHLGRAAEATSAGHELLARQPDFSVSGYLRSHPAADFEFGRNAAKALSAAGIP